jgi:RNA polymerase-binding transcription factor DksA
MATKKPLKAGKAAVKASKPAKKVALKKTIPSKATKSAVAPKPAPKKVKKQRKTAVSPAKKPVATAKKVAKVSNSTAKTATSKLKVSAKEVVKKTKEQVKKTPVTDKKETTKAAAPAKKAATAEKKTVKAASEKTVTPEAINETVPATKAVATSKLNGRSDEKKAEKVKNDKPVVIPKTSTDKKVDYDPDFTKSVLDTPAAVQGNPTMRYSDAELQEFRDLINKKLDSAKKELAYLQGLITRRDEMGGDETDNRYMTMEDGGMSMEREQLSQMASRQITFIDHLEKALMRIENKTYGICRVTGKLIDKARLRAVPHATLSMEAKLGITK